MQDTKRPERSFLSTIFRAGDKCANLGSLDVPGQQLPTHREVELRFVCADGYTPNDGDRLLTVHEVASCKYRVLFAATALCELPEFSHARRLPDHIRCFAEQDKVDSSSLP